jgi:predicted alpha/beta-hydrolase family hydrolase
MTQAADFTPFEEGSVRGYLHQPLNSKGIGLVLTHGAGANCRAPLLVAVATAFCAAGFTVLRCDLPFRQKRPFGPPHPSTAASDRAALKDAVEVVRKLASGNIILGGHSYGGRQASMLSAEEPGCADSLLLLSYPLHPPNKREQLRTAHFSQLQAPALFVHGTKDPFGSMEELHTAVALIPASTKIVPIEGAGHDLRGGKFDISGLVASVS